MSARFAVLQFPGSNCDQDCFHVVRDIFKQEVRYVWHQDTKLFSDEIILVPGGFSYGDYLRCGAIAKVSPIMKEMKKAAEQGQLIIGICNGFQILCEAGLLPGALLRNRKLHFMSRFVHLRVERTDSHFTSVYQKNAVIRMPIAHGEGSYFAEPKLLEELEANRQILFKYCDFKGQLSESSNLNGSCHAIAGICNKEGNVLGMMPHPERASDLMLGSSDGRGIFESLLNARLAFSSSFSISSTQHALGIR